MLTVAGGILLALGVLLFAGPIVRGAWLVLPVLLFGALVLASLAG